MNWKKRRHHHMGGTVALGFDSSSRYLLVLSHQGLGIYDANTGDLVERDRDWNYEGYRDFEVDGVGILNGEVVPISGLHCEPSLETKKELENFDIQNQLTEFKGAVISKDENLLAIGYSDLIELYEINTQQGAAHNSGGSASSIVRS